jgi:hypothetical protein
MCLDLLVAFGLEQSVEALRHRTNSTNGVADLRRSTCDFQFRAYNNRRGSSMESAWRQVPSKVRLDPGCSRCTNQWPLWVRHTDANSPPIRPALLG